jgi:hypothetical protein
MIVIVTLNQAGVMEHRSTSHLGIKEVQTNFKHMMTNMCCPPFIYIQRGDLTSKQTTLINLEASQTDLFNRNDLREGLVMGGLPI